MPPARMLHHVQAPSADARAPSRRSVICRPRHAASMPAGAKRPLAANSLAHRRSRSERGETCGLRVAKPWARGQATMRTATAGAGSQRPSVRAPARGRRFCAGARRQPSWSRRPSWVCFSGCMSYPPSRYSNLSTRRASAMSTDQGRSDIVNGAAVHATTGAPGRGAGARWTWARPGSPRARARPHDEAKQIGVSLHTVLHSNGASRGAARRLPGRGPGGRDVGAHRPDLRLARMSHQVPSESVEAPVDPGWARDWRPPACLWHFKGANPRTGPETLAHRRSQPGRGEICGLEA